MNDELWEFSPNDTQRILTILSFLRQSTCPYIGHPVFRAFDDVNQKADEKSNKESSSLRIILSYPLFAQKMTLHQYLQLDSSRCDDVKLTLAYQLVQAVAFLHTCGVSHQFLSSDAVLVELDSCPTIKITNFCSCTTSTDCSSSYICVRNYRPPEVVLQLSAIKSTLVDSWALGCLLFEVYTGSPAFSLEPTGGNFRPQLIKQQLMETVKGVGRLGVTDIPPGCPERVSQYVLSLDYDPSIYARMRAVGSPEVAERWVSLVRPLLHFNFLLRSTANEVLQHEIFAELPPPASWSVPCGVSTRLQDLLD